MKINLQYNDFIKEIDLDLSTRIGILQENILNYCSLIIYNIEYSEIIIDNKPYILGSDEIPFDSTLQQFIDNELERRGEGRVAGGGGIGSKIIINDRKRDINGNVIKNNYIIERYNKWYQKYENEKFENEHTKHFIRFPISSLLETILRIPLSETLGEDGEIVGNCEEACEEECEGACEGECEGECEGACEEECEEACDKGIQESIEEVGLSQWKSECDEGVQIPLISNYGLNTNSAEETKSYFVELDCGKANAMNKSIEELDTARENDMKELNQPDAGEESGKIVETCDVGFQPCTGDESQPCTEDDSQSVAGDNSCTSPSWTPSNIISGIQGIHQQYTQYTQSFQHMDDIITMFDSYIQNTENINNTQLYGSFNNTFFNMTLNLDEYDDLPDLISVNDMYDNYEDVKIILNEEQFNKLTMLEYSELEETDSKECLICIDEFINTDEITKISPSVKIKELDCGCNHVFHKKCIKSWLCEHSNKCPVCRVEVDKGSPKGL